MKTCFEEPSGSPFKIAFLIPVSFVLLGISLIPGSCIINACPRYESYHYEMHYGFIRELLHSGNENPVTLSVTLTPSYSGSACSSPFCSALHLTSELLWESEDVNSELSEEQCNTSGGSYHKYITWSTTTGTEGDPWDGLSFVFGNPKNDPDGAQLSIEVTATQNGTEVFNQAYSYTAYELKNLYPQINKDGIPNPPMTVPISQEGQELEFGSHFSLNYRLYDFLVFWGYGAFEHDDPPHDENCENPKWPLGAPSLANWSGKLKLNDGMINPIKTMYFDKSGDTVTDLDGNPVSPGELLQEIRFNSQAEEILEERDSKPNDGNPGEFNFGDEHLVHQGNAEGLQMNLVVPTSAFANSQKPEFSVHIEADGYTVLDGSLMAEFDPETGETEGGLYNLPWRWTDMDALFRCPDTQHVAHAHQHWCWYKHEY